MNLKFSRWSLLLAAALLSPAPVLAQGAAGKPVATVNGSAVPQNRADALLAEQKAQGVAETEQLRAQVKEELVRREVLSQAAKGKGLDKKPEVIGQMELARQAVLIRAYLQDYMRSRPVNDADLKKEFDGINKQLGGKEYKARHILVEKEDEAKDIIGKLKKGEKFEDLAKQSKDPGSKDRGGDLGWSTPANYVKPFGDALVALQKGKYTDAPVKTDFGYHVIQQEDVRDLKLPTFEEAKPALQQRMQQQMVEKHILELRGKAKVE